MHMPEKDDEEQDGIISECISAERGEERQSLRRGENQVGEAHGDLRGQQDLASKCPRTRTGPAQGTVAVHREPDRNYSWDTGEAVHSGSSDYRGGLWLQTGPVSSSEAEQPLILGASKSRPTMRQLTLRYLCTLGLLVPKRPASTSDQHCIVFTEEYAVQRFIEEHSGSQTGLLLAPSAPCETTNIPLKAVYCSPVYLRGRRVGGGRRAELRLNDAFSGVRVT